MIWSSANRRPLSAAEVPSQGDFKPHFSAGRCSSEQSPLPAGQQWYHQAVVILALKEHEGKVEVYLDKWYSKTTAVEVTPTACSSFRRKPVVDLKEISLSK